MINSNKPWMFVFSMVMAVFNLGYRWWLMCLIWIIIAFVILVQRFKKEKAK